MRQSTARIPPGGVRGEAKQSQPSTRSRCTPPSSIYSPTRTRSRAAQPRAPPPRRPPSRRAKDASRQHGILRRTRRGFRYDDSCFTLLHPHARLLPMLANAHRCPTDARSDRQRAPVGLSLDLPHTNLPSPSFSSNNPFRRAASPSPRHPSFNSNTLPVVQRPERPMSTNPFLDDDEVARLRQQQARPVQVPEDIFVSAPAFAVARANALQLPCHSASLCHLSWQNWRFPKPPRLLVLRHKLPLISTLQ